MRIPIAHSLAWPERMDTPCERLDLVRIRSLDFEAPDLERFPALGLARSALAGGAAKPAILNAANEIAVSSFLGGEIGFLDIATIADETLQELDLPAPDSVEDVLEIDREARASAEAMTRRYSN
jgi:1-deoxy-D-xylulose-5-phosphate reductoisomerase